MTSMLNKWTEKDSPQDGERIYGEAYREEITILNQNFLVSIQNELKNCPDACLAPLAMDYMNFLYPLVKSPNGKVPENETSDFIEVAKYFNDVRDKLSNGEGKSKLIGKGNSNDSAMGDSVKKFPNAPTSTETDDKQTSQSTPAPGPGFFELLGAKGESGDSKDKTVRLGKSSTDVATTKPPSAFPGSSSTSAFQNFSFGIAPTTSSSGSVPTEPAVGSVLEKPSTSSTTSTPSMAMFAFGSMSSAPKLVTTASTTSSFPSSSSGITSSLFGGGLSGSGFGQSGFGTGFGGAGSSLGFDAAKGNVNGTNDENKDDSDDDSPPKPEFVPVVESDSLYTQRIKVYEMQGKAYKDLGIGNLFIKELAGPKYQLVVRADNSLGTILVNVVLNASILLKQNKPINILATVPSSEGKPTTYLFRVKEDTVGNELFNLLEKYKNS